MSLLSINSINPDSHLSAALSVYFARLALPVWQEGYPKDLRPEKAIEAAEKALFADAADAANATKAADYAARAAANAAANAAYAAATNSAYAAASAAANVYAAADAAADAARAALGKDEELFAHQHLTQLLPIILWHKITSKRSFAEPEKVFELLSEDCREDFLFNLEVLM